MLVSNLFLWTAIFFVWRCSIDRPRFMLVRLRLKKNFFESNLLTRKFDRWSWKLRQILSDPAAFSDWQLSSYSSFKKKFSPRQVLLDANVWDGGLETRGARFCRSENQWLQWTVHHGKSGHMDAWQLLFLHPKMRLFYMKNYGKRVKCWFSRSEACRNRTGPRRQTKMALGNWSTTEEVVPRPLPSIMDLWFWRQLGSTKIDVSCHFSRINKPGRVVR